MFGGNLEKTFVRETFLTVIDVVKRSKGTKAVLSSVLRKSVWNNLIEAYRVPDWQQLFVKLATKLPDKSWQTVINFLQAGRTGVSEFQTTSKIIRFQSSQNL